MGEIHGADGTIFLYQYQISSRVFLTFIQNTRTTPTNIGLGGYPIATLAEARQTVISNRRSIAQGRDPRAGGMPTFEEAAEKVIASHEPTWKDGARSAANGGRA